MATSTLVERDEEKTPSTPVATPTTTPTTTPAVTDSVDRERSPRRETILLMALVGLVAAVVLFGLAFPELLAPAVAIALLTPVLSPLIGFLPENCGSSRGHHRMR